jgi:hypothetical protein
MQAEGARSDPSSWCPEPVGSVVLSADPQTLGNEPSPLVHQLGELAGGKVVGALVELVGLGSPSVRGLDSVRSLSGGWRAVQNGCCDRLRRP